MKKILTLGAALVAAGMLVFAVASMNHGASAQGIVYNKTGTSAVGMIVPVFNALDSTFTDGSWMMLDSLSTNRRVVVRPWNCNIGQDQRFAGILVGTLPKSSQGANGQLLIWGYHPNANMVTGVAAFGGIGPSAVRWGSGGAYADTLNIGRGLGFLINYVGQTLKGRVYITRGGSVQ